MSPEYFAVTGASSGIGAAIVTALVESGRDVLATGRNTASLDELKLRHGSRLQVIVADLNDAKQVDLLAERIASCSPRLPGLIHCAGVYFPGMLGSVVPSTLDRMIATNFRAPYVLTNRLVANLAAARGHIIFINSTAGLTSRGGNSGYSASKFALRALADAARAELNGSGIRVASVFPGRTATSGMEQLFNAEGRAPDLSRLLQTNDIARVVIQIIDAPEHVEITDVMVRPRAKSY